MEMHYYLTSWNGITITNYNVSVQSVNQVKIADAMIPKIANLLDKDDSSEVEEVIRIF